MRTRWSRWWRGGRGERRTGITAHGIGEALYPRLIHCCSLDSDHTDQLIDAVTELAVELQHHYPQIPPLAAVPLTGVSAELLFDHLCRNMPGGPPDFTDHPQIAGRRLLVHCPAQHPFVRVAQAENPLARWGIGVPRRFAVVWVENKYLWWHEALHLFNAKDCYNQFGIHKCPEPRCIMQAAPTAESCDRRLYLCSKNVRRLQEEPVDT